MKREDLIILLIGLLLLAGMIITAFIGRGKSMHGVGFLNDGKTTQQKALGLAVINQEIIPHCQDGYFMLPVPGIPAKILSGKVTYSHFFFLKYSN
jgi:hypothetical protein